MRSLTETLSSLTVDELPLILPLLQRINQDIAANPSLPSLPRVFIALWTRIASSLHEEQVAALLLTSLSQFLEQSLQAHNFLPLESLCDRATLSSLLQDLGPKQFLKLLLPYMMELLLSNQTPSATQDVLVTAISFLSSPRLLGPALTTRYLLPTLTVKTGSITFKRSDTMRPWTEGTRLVLSLSLADDSLLPVLCPAARALIAVLGYVTPEALVSITLAHLFPKAYSLLALLEPSPATPTLKSIQAALCVSEIIEVVRALLPFFSPKLFLYNVIQRPNPRLGDLLPFLYLPVASDDSYRAIAAPLRCSDLRQRHAHRLRRHALLRRGVARRRQDAGRLHDRRFARVLRAVPRVLPRSRRRAHPGDLQSHSPQGQVRRRLPEAEAQPLALHVFLRAPRAPPRYSFFPSLLTSETDASLQASPQP